MHDPNCTPSNDNNEISCHQEVAAVFYGASVALDDAYHLRPSQPFVAKTALQISIRETETPLKARFRPAHNSFSVSEIHTQGPPGTPVLFVYLRRTAKLQVGYYHPNLSAARVNQTLSAALQPLMCHQE